MNPSILLAAGKSAIMNSTKTLNILNFLSPRRTSFTYWRSIILWMSGSVNVSKYSESYVPGINAQFKAFAALRQCPNSRLRIVNTAVHASALCVRP